YLCLQNHWNLPSKLNHYLLESNGTDTPSSLQYVRMSISIIMIFSIIKFTIGKKRNMARNHMVLKQETS
ncbi:hypothetical protein, partial [Lacrimispora sp.]|uniref:hypothetical protein n=1 Tax=Lacrimispora sp. TaxID=2719234 RepID=UPI0028ABBE81